LKPFHDSIVELRGKNASYAAIAELLEQHGVKTSRARVAEYGRVVLEGGKRRKRRKRAQTTPAVNIPAAPQSAPDVAKKTVPTAAPTVTSNVPVPPSENSPYRSRGPHIAKVELLPASELGY
jgi:predicted sugar kinase